MFYDPTLPEIAVTSSEIVIAFTPKELIVFLVVCILILAARR